MLRKFKLLRKLSILPGHFYSPVVMPGELKGYENEIFNFNKSLDGIELNENKQMELLNAIKSFYSELPFTYDKVPERRYYYNNDYFSYNSAIELFGIIRHYKPNRIIEIGSGFSSSLMLDTNDLFMNGSMACTFIDPYPERLISLLNERDKIRHHIYAKKIQDIDLNIFSELKENDILFIDSSHVSKTGSDLNKIIFEILPVLSKGVIIHFHDVFYPFEYPANWVLSPGGFGWNENYILRAFLMYNSNFEILLFNSYMETKFKEWFEHNMPDCLKRQGGSLFLKKST